MEWNPCVGVCMYVYLCGEVELIYIYTSTSTSTTTSTTTTITITTCSGPDRKRGMWGGWMDGWMEGGREVVCMLSWFW